MNFVGHAYIARNHPHLIAGNFAGDSYKGHLSNFSHLPDHILKGIELHRYIDHFTDTSPIIHSIGQIFRAQNIRKVTAIASDILLDHYITKNWHLYSSDTFKSFVDKVYDETDKNLTHLEEDFCFMYERLKEQGWLFQYHTEEGIDMILWQFSRRIGFKNDLTACMPVYIKEREQIDDLFQQFMTEIVENSGKFISTSL